MGYVREKFILTGELWQKMDEMSQQSENSLDNMKECLGDKAGESMNLFVLEEKGYRRALNEIMNFLQGVENDEERKNFEDYMEEEIGESIKYAKEEWEREQKQLQEQSDRNKIRTKLTNPTKVS